MAKKRKKKFRSRYKSMTEIGRILGLSGRALGAKLKELELRNADGTASDEALEQGLAVSTPLKNGTPHFMWDKKALLSLLADHGVRPDKGAAEQLRLRETVTDLVHLIESEDFEMGGGMGYKIALEMLFVEYLPRLPLPGKLRQVRQTIHRSRARAETREYLLLLANSRSAGSAKLSDEIARYIIERENDWQVLEALSKNTNLSEHTTAQASSKCYRHAPPFIQQKLVASSIPGEEEP